MKKILIWLPWLLKEVDLAKSTSEGKRLIKQDAIKIDGMKIKTEYILIGDNS